MTLLIIIPAYNEERYILECLNEVQLLTQNEAVDILCIDDGSTDNTVSIIEKHSKIKILKHNRNRGYHATLSTAMNYVQQNDKRYSHLVFVDADLENNDGLSKILKLDWKSYQAIIGVRSYRNRFCEWLPFFDLFNNRKITDPFCGLKMFKVESLPIDNLNYTLFLIPEIIASKNLLQVSFNSRIPRRISRFDSNRIRGEIKILIKYLALYKHVI